MRIKTGDNVVVIAGKSKGTKGKVLRVDAAKDRVIVEGANIQTVHRKPRGPQDPGGLIKREGSIHISNVMIYCSKCDAGRRFGVEVDSSGKKTRVCRKCSSKFDK